MIHLPKKVQPRVFYNYLHTKKIKLSTVYFTKKCQLKFYINRNQIYKKSLETQGI